METSRLSMGGSKTSKKKSTRSTPNEPSSSSHSLDFDILTIKNVVSKRYPIEVNLTIFFKQRLLTTTPNFIIRSPGTYRIDFNFKFKIRKINAEMMDQLISEPLLIVLTKLRHGQLNKVNYFSAKSYSRSMRFRNKLELMTATPRSPSLTEEELKELEKRQIKRFKGEESTVLPCTLGECTLDLLPLVKGQLVIEEELLLERPMRYRTLPLRMRPINSRMVLSIRVSDENNFTKDLPPLHNVLMYTVEALYNYDVEKLSVNELSTITATMPLPHNVPTNSEERAFTLYHFEPGIISSSVNIDYKKKWYGLANILRGKGSYSNHRIPTGYDGIMNNMGIDLQKNIEKHQPRINWNIMRRIYMTPETEDVFIHNLIQYRCLPVEILFNMSGTVDLKGITGKTIGSQSSLFSYRKMSRVSISSQRRNTKLRKLLESTDNVDVGHFVAFLDISKLLIPGVTSARIAAPVQRISSVDYKQKWNAKEPILKNHLVGANIPNAYEETDEFSIPGTTCFIIVEISLMKPLIPEKESLGWEMSMPQLATEKINDNTLNSNVVPMDHFAKATKFIIFLIKREMEDFYMLRHCKQYSEVSYYKEMDFWGHLGHSGAMKIIHETLRTSVNNYIHNVLGTPQDNLTSLERKEYMANLYFKIVDKIHQVINTLLQSDKGRIEKIVHYSKPDMDELLLYAVEAGEQLQFPKARYYLAKRLEMNGFRNPDYWFDYGVMALRFGDVYLAIESMKEVLAIYPRHRMGLLAYAILLTVMGEYEEAEKFFYSCVKFYPTFWQAWITYHVFYKHIELFEGADITFVLGVRYMSEFPLKKEWQPNIPRITWYIDLCNCFNVFLETAKFLLSYNLFEFAEMCLAEYLDSVDKKDVCFYYYLAVCHFIQGRFQDSLVHLAQLIEETNIENYKVWSLIGFNYYNLGNSDQARKAFIEAQKCLKDYSAVPFMLIRVGFDYIERGCSEKAKEFFLEVLKTYHTPLAWTGLGISYYLMEDFEKSEIALLEANALDPNQAIVWTYLALIFLQRHSLFLYVQCLLEARRCGLEDKKLFKQLEALQERMYSESTVKQEISVAEKSPTNSLYCLPKCCNN
ncbi:cilia- and flagella-associated protein 70-like isoform X2 [Cimex lectularius]|uniref:Uncharacterized protein n=1 Tax=Cimex lectularius TaxID=79782 RepID=A0A8I6SL33_CIMLE|nr:cilia- and flagella-associated protein 70-like isoform X2 [Cimex lectularius]